MNKIVLNKNTFLIPAAWPEMQPGQLLKIAPLLLGPEQTLAVRKAAVLFIFFPAVKRFWLHHPWVVYLIKKFPAVAGKYPVLNEGQKWDLLGCVNFLFNEINGATILKEFTHQGVRYYLPGDNFTRESIIAFAFADDYFNRYTETGDEQYINRCIACIARQRGCTAFPALQFGEGDLREHFSTSRTEQRAKAFKSLDINIKTAILLYFMGSKKYIHKHYEILFRKKKEEDATEEPQAGDRKARVKTFGKKKVPKPNFNWLGIIYELSERGTFGSFDQVKHMFIHTCCYYLAKKRYEEEEKTA